jgi:hypothetical protein
MRLQIVAFASDVLSAAAPMMTTMAKRKQPKLGSGKRFASLEMSFAHRGVRSPGGLAAWIGRRKYGSKRFASLSVGGRRRSKRLRRNIGYYT